MKKVVLLIALSLQFIGTLFYFWIIQDPFWAKLVFSSVKIMLFLLPLLCFSVYKLPAFFARTNLSQSMVWGVLSGVILFFLVTGLYALFPDYFNQFSGEVLNQVNQFGLGPYYLLFAIIYSLGHSLFEEYYWRWFVYGSLKTVVSPMLAGIISSIAFASHHYLVLGQFFPLWLTILFGTAVGIGGWIWVYLYQKTNNLVGSWISHAFVDAAIFFVGYLLIF